jgi:hypothetical protein
MKLKKVKRGSYQYKNYCIDYLPEIKIWNVSCWHSAGWPFRAEFKTLRECREWLVKEQS